MSVVKPKPKESQGPIRTKGTTQGANENSNTCERSHADQARENASDLVALGVSFASDLLGRWRQFSRPITERRKAKPMQSRITFDTQLKIALSC